VVGTELFLEVADFFHKAFIFLAVVRDQVIEFLQFRSFLPTVVALRRVQGGCSLLMDLGVLLATGVTDLLELFHVGIPTRGVVMRAVLPFHRLLRHPHPFPQPLILLLLELEVFCDLFQGSGEL